MGSGLFPGRVQTVSAYYMRLVCVKLSGLMASFGGWTPLVITRTCLGCGREYLRWRTKAPSLYKIHFCGWKCNQSWTSGYISGCKFAEDRSNVRPYPVARRRA